MERYLIDFSFKPSLISIVIRFLAALTLCCILIVAIGLQTPYTHTTHTHTDSPTHTHTPAAYCIAYKVLL